MFNFTNLLAVTASVIALAGGAADASPAFATNDLNVRSGPGTQFDVLDQLFRNEPVEVVECVNTGWCRVQHNGPMGWVFTRYLGGWNGQVGNNAGNGVPQGGQNGAAQACFYTEPHHQGQNFCIGEGTIPQLPFPFNNNISSYRVSGGAKVRFCVDSFLNSSCYEGSRSSPTLGFVLDNQASSLLVSSIPVGGNQNNQPGNQGNQGQNNQQGNQGQNNAGNQGANNGGNAQQPNDPNCSAAFVIDSDGKPAFTLTCGDNPILPPAGGGNNAGNGGGHGQPVPPADGGVVRIPVPLPAVAPATGLCFYNNLNFAGGKTCIAGNREKQVINMRAGFAPKSVMIAQGTTARICARPQLKGRCINYKGQRSPFSASLNRGIGSVRFISNRNLPQVKAGGRAFLARGDSLEMDLHVINQSIRGADITMSHIPGGILTMKFGRGVKMKNMGTRPQNYVSCYLNNLREPQTNLFSVSALPVNTTFCVRTSGGRIAKLKYVGTRNNKAKFIAKTWKRN